VLISLADARQSFKDHPNKTEDDASQLNRLGLANRQDMKLVGAQRVSSLVSPLPRFWQRL
jgi:hypothetical protein